MGVLDLPVGQQVRPGLPVRQHSQAPLVVLDEGRERPAPVTLICGLAALLTALDRGV